MKHHFLRLSKYMLVALVAVFVYQIIHCWFPNLMFETEEEKKDKCHVHDLPVKVWRSFVVTLIVSLFVEFLEEVKIY